MIYNNLFDYYKSLDTLIRHHNYDGEYLNNLIPFERDLITTLIINEKAELNKT